ncbi:MAG: hypothetical protein KDA33_17915, partial [Phycisphaerales bacterium]|nr:hypothetical protein [Phycisphaerales bacterium]
MRFLIRLAAVLAMVNIAPIASAALAPAIYWTDSNLSRIYKSNLDGTGQSTVVSSGLIDPRGIVVDQRGAGALYWADRGTNRIERSNLDGSGRQILVANLGDPNHLALDFDAGRIYWTDSIQRTIQRINLNGSDVQVLVSDDLYGPYGIDIDKENGHVYWADAIGSPPPSKIS